MKRTPTLGRAFLGALVCGSVLLRAAAPLDDDASSTAALDGTPALEAQDEELDELDLEEEQRAALEDLRRRDADLWEWLVEALAEDDDEAWEVLDAHVDYLERVAEASPRVRRALAAQDELAQRVRTSVERFHDAESDAARRAAEGEVRAALESWFDLRQELRAFDVEAIREEVADFRSELLEHRDPDDREDAAADWLFGALEEAGPERMEELDEERVYLWGEAMELVDEELGEWWWELVETDPDGAYETFEAWRAAEPELFERVVAAGGAGLELLETERELHLWVLENDSPRRDEEQIERTVESVFDAEPTHPLVPLLRRAAELDAQVANEEFAVLEDELVELESQRAARAALRDTIVTAELLRATDREHLLDW